MKTIGMRVSPSEVTFSIFDTVENSIINIEEILIPNALTVPERLKYIRCNILDVLREYEVKKAGIRLSEPSAKNDLDRQSIKPLVKGDVNHDDVENWQGLSEKEREAVLTAIGAKNA
mgnify:CR=1 FL=1